MLLTGKAAIVTGGARGIGYAITENFCMEGACVAFSDLNEELGRRAAEQLTRQGHNVIFIPADVSVAADVERMVNTALEHFGRVDILVNNAGITRDALLLRLSADDFDAVLSTNLRGAFLCMKQASKLMMKQRFGRIINISSVVALRGNAGQVNYAASKAGIIGMTKSLARELASRNVTVNALAPGFIETAMTAELPEAVRAKMLEGIPAGRMGQPEDVAAAALFLASPQAAYITGQVLRVDGGMAM